MVFVKNLLQRGLCGLFLGLWSTPSHSVSVESITFQAKEDQVQILIKAPEKLDPHITENEKMHQLLLRFPKTDLDHIPINDESEGLLDHSFVDQSHPNSTTLVIFFKKDITVLSQGALTDGGAAGFQITMGPAGDKPAWGQATATPAEKIQPQQNAEKTVVAVDPFAFQTQEPIMPSKDVRYEEGTVNTTSLSVGPYVGGAMGLGSGSLKTHFDDGQGYVQNFRKQVTGYNLGGFVGYGIGIKNFVIAPEFFFNQDRLDGTRYGTTSKSKDFLEYTYGLVLRLGALLTPEALLSLRIGGVGTRMVHKGTDDGDFSKNLAGVLYGLGIETAIGSHTSLRLDFNHIDYQSFSQPSTLWPTRNLALKTNQILLGLSYQLQERFGPNSPLGIQEIPTGFYVGGGLTLSNFAVSRRYNNYIRWKEKLSVMTPMLLLQAGYGVQYGDLYAGLEIETALGNHHLSADNGDPYGDYTDLSIKIQPSVGIYVRPGFTFGHGNMLYGKFGILRSWFKKNAAVVGNDFYSASGVLRKRLGGISLGGGLEVFQSNSLSFRIEYAHEIYKKLSQVGADGGLEFFAPTNDKVSFSINYFPT